MMERLSASILSTYVKSSRACRMGAVCELEGKKGILVLDLSEFKNATHCDFNFRRKSGNGLVNVVSGEHKMYASITSRRSQTITIELDSSKSVSVLRPGLSIGFLDLLDVTVHTSETEVEDKKPTEEPVEAEPKKRTNWHKILKQCKSYRSVKIVDEKLFAFEGGVIEAGHVHNIETQPPGAYSIKDNRIVKFSISCEILELSIKREPEPRQNPYPHFESPGKITPVHQEHTAAPLQIPVRRHQDTQMTTHSTSKIVYDSLKFRFTKGSSAPNAQARISQDGSSIRLGHKGSFSIPIAEIMPESEYIVSIEMNKANGNGKVTAYLAPVSSGKAALAFATPHRRSISLCVVSGNIPPQPGQSYRLVIERPNAATGDVIITRIMVLTGMNLSAAYSKATASIINYRPATIVSSSVSYGLKIESDDPVYVAAKQYGRYENTFATQFTDKDVKGVITITSVSGLSWFSKVSPLVPNLHLNKRKEHRGSIMMGSIGALYPADTIYVEEFLGDTISEPDHVALSQAKKIISPSFSNIELFRMRYNKAKVTKMHRPWSFVNTRPLPHIKKGYILVPYRGAYTTKMITDIWKDGMPKIVLLGGRGKFPNHVLPTNEYLRYPNLLHLLMYAKCVVDIPLINDYDSSLQDIIKALNIPLVTSNWGSMDSEGFVIPEEQYKDFAIPSKQGLKNGLEWALSAEPGTGNIGDYNNHLFSIMRDMLDDTSI